MHYLICIQGIYLQVTAQIDQVEDPQPDRPPEGPSKEQTNNEEDDDYSGGLC